MYAPPPRTYPEHFDARVLSKHLRLSPNGFHVRSPTSHDENELCVRSTCPVGSAHVSLIKQLVNQTARLAQAIIPILQACCTSTSTFGRSPWMLFEMLYAALPSNYGTLQPLRSRANEKRSVDLGSCGNIPKTTYCRGGERHAPSPPSLHQA